MASRRRASASSWQRTANNRPPPCTPSSVLSSSATRSTREWPRRRASLLREDGAARPVRLQELRQRGWRTRGMQDSHRATSVRKDHPQCRAFTRRFCGERCQYVLFFFLPFLRLFVPTSLSLSLSLSFVRFRFRCFDCSFYFSCRRNARKSERFSLPRVSSFEFSVDQV